MNKPITEWPASIIVAIAVSIGCGFVLNTYWDAAVDDLTDIGLPQIMTLVAIVVGVAIWAETIRSFKDFQEKQRTPPPPVETEKMVWPELAKDAKPLEPVKTLGKVFKLDE